MKMLTSAGAPASKALQSHRTIAPSPSLPIFKRPLSNPPCSGYRPIANGGKKKTQPQRASESEKPKVKRQAPVAEDSDNEAEGSIDIDKLLADQGAVQQLRQSLISSMSSQHEVATSAQSGPADRDEEVAGGRAAASASNDRRDRGASQTKASDGDSRGSKRSSEPRGGGGGSERSSRGSRGVRQLVIRAGVVAVRSWRCMHWHLLCLRTCHHLHPHRPHTPQALLLPARL
mmetsp:Transcript_28977/g.63920  ORF Transcript_28977/g.63920 Transcript_28977/m.63920 type:complete len:231 (+) Transcript_28977:109-801(+)